MRTRLALLALVAGCSGPAKGSSTTPEGPEPGGDGWACFSWDDMASKSKVSHCEADRATCRDTQQAAPNAAITTGCHRTASVWCYTPHIAQDDSWADVGGGDTGKATCVRTAVECNKKRGSSDSQCLERHDGQRGERTREEMKADLDRIAAEKARLEKQSSTTFSCFTFKANATGLNETDCYRTRDCDDKQAEAARSGAGTAYSQCIEAINVWCFEQKGSKICKLNQDRCEEKRQAVLGKKATSANECAVEH
jgi:hypothetical protein